MATGDQLTEFARIAPQAGPFRDGIVLYGASTPNTHKISMLLEELRVPYDVVAIDIGKNTQKEEWFLEICPNGRTPAMIDCSQANDPFALFESGAMMLYICDKFDSAGVFLPKEPRGRSEVEQWLMWQMSALGPMLGNCMYFKRIAAPMIDDISSLQFGIDRYHNESVRLLQILEKRLSGGRQYLCGIAPGKYSVADIACWPYAQSHWWAGIETDTMPNLCAWIDRIRARSATVAGLLVPTGSSGIMNDHSEQGLALRKRVEENAARAGRPHFGWRDLMEVQGGVRLSGALAAPSKAKL